MVQIKVLMLRELNQFAQVLQQLTSQVAHLVKNLPANAEDLRDVGSIPGSGRAPGKGHGKPLQYFPGESLGQRSLKGYNP